MLNGRIIDGLKAQNMWNKGWREGFEQLKKNKEEPRDARIVRRFLLE